MSVGSSSAPTFADIDGDGDLDAFIGEYDGNINFYRNDSGTFTEVTGSDNPFDGVSVGSYSTPTFADIDSDGDLDAFIGESDGNINFYRNDSGTFTSVTGTGNPFNGTDVGSYHTPTLADIDGDGDLDAFIGEYDVNIYFYRNDSGTFTSVIGTGNPFNGTDVGYNSTPTLADIDSDGDLDAFIGEYDVNIYFYRNDSGTFTSVTGTGNPFNGTDVGSYHTPTLADIDSDGDLDAFIGERDGNINFYENAITASITAGTAPAEGGANGTFTITLSKPALDGGLTVNYIVGGTATAGDDYDTLSGTVTFAPGESSKTITVAAVDDAIDDDGETVTVTLTDGADYNLGSSGDDTLTIADNDTAGVTVTPTTLTTPEGGTGTFSVVLTSQPTADVTVDLVSSDTLEGTVSVSTLTFTAANWNTAQTLTVTGVDRSVDGGDGSYTIQTAVSSSDTLYAAIDPNDVAVTNTDDDTAGVTVTPTTLTTAEGGTGTFSVVLTSQPTADVTVDLVSSDTLEGTRRVRFGDCSPPLP